MRKTISLLILALAALACGDVEHPPIQPWTGVLPASPLPDPVYRADGCEEVDSFEAPHVGKPGYNFDGCTKSDRMAWVAPFADDDDWGEPTDIGQAEQPITVLNAFKAATPISVNSSQQITGFLGGPCPVKLNWTTAEALRGNCLIPNRVAGINYKVCPSCYSSDNAGFVNARMIQAWGVWSRPVTCNGVTVTPQIADKFNAELNTFATAEENYDNARIVIFPTSGLFAGARMGVDKDFLVGKTPVRSGIRYWGWDYASLEIDHQVIESIKLPVCVSATDPQLDRKMKNGYTWILAHELGHAWGMGHASLGIMRRGSVTPCTEVFSGASPATDPPALSAAITSERLVAASMRDSSGFSTIPVATGVTGCSEDLSTVVSGVPDDQSVVAF